MNRFHVLRAFKATLWHHKAARFQINLAIDMSQASRRAGEKPMFQIQQPSLRRFNELREVFLVLTQLTYDTKVARHVVEGPKRLIYQVHSRPMTLAVRALVDCQKYITGQRARRGSDGQFGNAYLRIGRATRGSRSCIPRAQTKPLMDLDIPTMGHD